MILIGKSPTVEGQEEDSPPSPYQHREEQVEWLARYGKL